MSFKVAKICGESDSFIRGTVKKGEGVGVSFALTPQPVIALHPACDKGLIRVGRSSFSGWKTRMGNETQLVTLGGQSDFISFRLCHPSCILMTFVCSRKNHFHLYHNSWLWFCYYHIYFYT